MVSPDDILEAMSQSLDLDGVLNTHWLIYMQFTVSCLHKAAGKLHLWGVHLVLHTTSQPVSWRGEVGVLFSASALSTFGPQRNHFVRFACLSACTRHTQDHPGSILYCHHGNISFVPAHLYLYIQLVAEYKVDQNGCQKYLNADEEVLQSCGHIINATFLPSWTIGQA